MKNQIANIRKKTGLSQVKFAERYNIPLATYTHWEQGRNLPPNYVVELLRNQVEYDYDWSKEYVTVAALKEQIEKLEVEQQTYKTEHNGETNSEIAKVIEFLKGFLDEWKNSH